MGIRSNSWSFVSEKVFFCAKNILLGNPRFCLWIGEWFFDVKFINLRPSECIIHEDRCDFGPPLYTHIDPDTVFFCLGFPNFFQKDFWRLGTRTGWCLHLMTTSPSQEPFRYTDLDALLYSPLASFGENFQLLPQFWWRPPRWTKPRPPADMFILIALSFGRVKLI